MAGCGLAPGVVPSPRPPPRGPLPELRHGVGLAPTEDPAGPTPQKAHRGLGVPGLVLRPGLLWSFSEMGGGGNRDLRVSWTDSLSSRSHPPVGAWGQRALVSTGALFPPSTGRQHPLLAPEDGGGRSTGRGRVRGGQFRRGGRPALRAGEPALGRPSGRLAPAPLGIWKSDWGLGLMTAGCVSSRGEGCGGPACALALWGLARTVTLRLAFPTPPRPVTPAAGPPVSSAEGGGQQPWRQVLPAQAGQGPWIWWPQVHSREGKWGPCDVGPGAPFGVQRS